jgi:uncharacterized protein (TIGR02246 family)
MKSIFSISFILLIVACNNSTVDTKAEGDKLMQVSRDWSKAAQTDSIDKILSYWADDAVVMLPGDDVIKGKQAIREMVEGSSKIPGFKISWEPVSASVSKSGDMAYLIENNQVSTTDSTGKTITQYNKAVTIWRKEADGSWKNVVDIFNANPAK